MNPKGAPMTDESPEWTPDTDEILRVIRLRLQILRPLVEECRRLEDAERALERAIGE
jgi:hypothetical protein